LALGTVQFGLDYGVSNQAGKVILNEAKAILKACEEFGIRSIDTALDYGDSEKVLGNIGVTNFLVTTKLSNLDTGNDSEISQLVRNQVKQSFLNLNCQHLHAVLVHNSRNLLSPKGQIIWKSLEDLKTQVNISKIGVSIYDPSELSNLEELGIYPEVVQVPYNVFDQKIYQSGWLQKLVDRGAEVHARSVFLQGLLLQEEKLRDRYFDRWSDKFNQFRYLFEKSGCTALEFSLKFALANPLFTKIIVGVQSVEQLQDIACVSTQLDNKIKACHLACEDLDLIRPQNWQLENNTWKNENYSDCTS